ncbi:Alpha-galactosidase [Raoultella terrigena]|nr:Alpha-galactosidase [Raoultella terrigena]
MSDSIVRLQSAGADVVIKTHPFAEIIYWGAAFKPFFAAGCGQPDAPGG